ncbi:lonely Cys domain-containing protein [Actinoallomurus soli]|uniref:lonely Cys domain-containing protein n=1 Tax=Actinoallomurus soli TaxID=2952535 RepID=UPI002091FA86|nr:lonely Cys domain-containing protein [Actinoallomurus soli]MCO5975018.1 lonely Cys domain-containing protein [Actinoallomurus soli]
MDEGLSVDEAAEWGRSFAQAHESGDHAAVAKLHGDLNTRIDQFLGQRVDEMTPRRDVRPGGGAEPVTGGQEEKSGVGEEVNPGSTADGERPGGADLVATHPGGDVLTPRSGGGWTTHRPGALPPVTVATPAADTPGTVQDDSQAGSYGRPDDGPTPADETPSLSPVSPLSPRTSRTPLSRLSPVTPMSPAGPAGPASRSASGGDRIVVAGRVESIDYEDHIVVDGESAPMTPDEFVAWLQERPEYEPGVPVVLLAGDASVFAFAVAPLLDAPVTGPWGDFSPIPTGDLAAGTLLRDPDGGLRIGDAPHDGWYTFGPDGDLVSRVRTLPDSGAFLRDQATAERVTGRPVGIWRSTTAPQKAAESPVPTPGGEETSHGAALAGDRPSGPGPEGGHAETVSPPPVDRPEDGTRIDDARATLDALPPAQRKGLLNLTDTIIREAITRPRTGQPRPRAPREWRLLVAAEIARSGEQAGENLAHTLVAEQPPTRNSAAEPSTQEQAASGAGGGTTRLPKGPVVEGEYHRESFTVRIPGSDQDLDPEQTARWIEGNTTYGPGRPVILNIPGVAMPGPGGGPSFADLVATHLGGTVVVPRSIGLSIGTGWTTHRPGELPASRRLDPDHAWNRLLDPAISAKRRREALGHAAKLVEDRIRQVRPGENPRGAVSRPDEIVVLVAAEYLRGPRSAGALTNLLIPEGIRPRPTVAGPAQHAEADDVAAPLTEAALASHAAERAFEQLAAGHRLVEGDPAWLEQTATSEAAVDEVTAAPLRPGTTTRPDTFDEDAIEVVDAADAASGQGEVVPDDDLGWDPDLVSEVNKVLRGRPGWTDGPVDAATVALWHSRLPEDWRRPVSGTRRDPAQKYWVPRLRVDRAAGIADLMMGRPLQRLRGGWDAYEAELTVPMRLRDDQNLAEMEGVVLAKGPGDSKVVVDTKELFRGPFGGYHRTAESARRAGGEDRPVKVPIPEVHIGLMPNLPGETSMEEMGVDEERAEALYEATAGALLSVPGMPGSEPEVPLEQVLERVGWTVTPEGRGILIGPPPVGGELAAHLHYNEGVPLEVLHPWLKVVLDGTWRDLSWDYYTRDHLADALDFADEVAARYIAREYLGFIPTDLTGAYQILDTIADLSVQKLRGIAAAAYVLAAMSVSYQLFGKLNKAHAAFILRHEPYYLLGQLPAEARERLSADGANIVRLFDEYIERRIPEYATFYQESVGVPGVYDRPSQLPLSANDDYRVEDLFNTFLREGYYPRVEQSDVLGGSTTFDTLDTNIRRTRALAVAEVRSFGKRHVRANEVRHYRRVLAGAVRSLYPRAEALNNLTAEEQEIVSHNVRTRLAELYGLRLPQGDGASAGITTDAYFVPMMEAFGPQLSRNPLTYTAMHQAVQRLDDMRRSDPVVGGGAFDLDALVRRVQVLDADAPVTQWQRRQVVQLAAEVGDQAGSLAELAARYLVGQGVLSSNRLRLPDGGAYGVNWLPQGADQDLDVLTVDAVVFERDGTWLRKPAQAAQWSPDGSLPYAVFAEGGPEHLVMPVGRERRRVPFDVVAEVLALDPLLAAETGGLAPDVPGLLAVSGAGRLGLEGPRWIAHRTGRNFWSTSSELDPDSDVLTTVERPGRPQGSWLLSRPDEVVPADPDAPGWVGQVVSHTVYVGGRRIRAAYHDAEYAGRREAYFHGIDQLDRYVHYDPVSDGLLATDELRVDWSYAYFAHGRLGRIGLPLEDGSVREVSYGAFARHGLSRRPSVRNLRKATAQDDGQYILLAPCWAGTPTAEPQPLGRHSGAPAPFVFDPLRTLSGPQEAANATRNMVVGPTRPSGLGRAQGKLIYGQMADLAGNMGAWVVARPEPEGEDLDALARAAGLADAAPAPVSDGARERTLVLVRALRWQFGPHVDRDPHFGELVRGIGGLERMRQADPALSPFGGFTVHLLSWAARAYGELPGVAYSDAGDLVRQMLSWSGAVVGTQPGARLIEVLPGLTRLRYVAQDLLGRDASTAEATGRRLLRLDASEPFGEAEWSRLFWSMAEADRWLSGLSDPDALAARVLHLERPEPGRRADFADLVVSAMAAGRDPDDTVQLGAFHLETLGAFGPDRELLDESGMPSGRNWSSDSTSGVRVRTSHLMILQEAGPGRPGTTRRAPAPWSRGGGKPVLMLYTGRIGSTQVALTIGGTRMQVPYAEFAELVSRDPLLLTRELTQRDVVTVSSGVAADRPRLERLSEWLLNATGRTQWMFPKGSGLVQPPRERGHWIGVFAVQGEDVLDQWLVIRPSRVDPASYAAVTGMALDADESDAASIFSDGESDDGVSVAGSVTSADQAMRLAGLSPGERMSELQFTSVDDRDALASDREFVRGLRQSLSPVEFASAVAELMIQVPPEVERPASARQRLDSIITEMLSSNPDVAEKVITAGGRVLIIPRNKRLTSLGPWREFAGKELVEGRSADEERSIQTGTLAAVSEEDLVGGTSPFGVPSPSGYSDAVNVFAQLLHAYGLDDETKDKIRDFYDEKLQQSNAVWPDGPLRAPNEPAKDPGDYFAALTNFYVEAHVTDSPYTVKGDGRLSGYHAAQRHDKDLHELLVDIYGRNAKIAETDSPEREDDRYSDFRAFWESADGMVESPAEAVSPDSGSAANTVTRPAVDVPGVVIGQPQADTGGPVARQLPAPDLEGDAEAVAAAPSYQVMNQPDEGPRHPAPPAAGGPVVVELDDSEWRKSSRSEGDCVEVVVWR